VPVIEFLNIKVHVVFVSECEVNGIKCFISFVVKMNVKE